MRRKHLLLNSDAFIVFIEHLPFGDHGYDHGISVVNQLQALHSYLNFTSTRRYFVLALA